jgi:hypothetical protein
MHMSPSLEIFTFTQENVYRTSHFEKNNSFWMGDAAHKWMRRSLMNMEYDRQLKGQCHEMDIFLKVLNILSSTFCVCADGFQDF